MERQTKQSSDASLTDRPNDQSQGGYFRLHVIAAATWSLQNLRQNAANFSSNLRKELHIESPKPERRPCNRSLSFYPYQLTVQ
jgi:hypothetical protein